MKVTVVDHPVVSATSSAPRDRTTDTSTFRWRRDDLVTPLADEATRGLPVEVAEVEPPVARTRGVRLMEPPSLVVPVRFGAAGTG